MYLKLRIQEIESERNDNRPKNCIAGFVILLGLMILDLFIGATVWYYLKAW